MTPPPRDRLGDHLLHEVDLLHQQLGSLEFKLRDELGLPEDHEAFVALARAHQHLTALREARAHGERPTEVPAGTEDELGVRSG